MGAATEKKSPQLQTPGRPHRSWWPIGVVVWIALCAGPAGACDVPVFQWALENWTPGTFEIVIFHRGPVGGEHAAAARFLKDASLDGAGRANHIVRLADVSGQLPGPIERIWRSSRAGTVTERGQSRPVLPWMVLLPPVDAAPEPAPNVWAGPLTMAAAKALVDSPVRREIAKRILGGDAAVWLLLESGHRAKDTAAADLLEKELKKAQETLELPEPVPEELLEVPPDAANEPVQGPAPPEIKITFSLIRLPRTEPAEKALVNMLLGGQPHLAKESASQPTAFPLFGRGRALCALIGKGINAENVQEISAFLAGPCSCMVKEQNPGADLLIRANWDGAFVGSQVREVTPPLLSGLPEVPEASSGSKQPEPPASRANAEPPAGGDGPGHLLRNVLIALGFAAAAAGLITLWASKRLSRN